MGELIGIVLALVFMALCIEIYLVLIGGSLFAGAIGGLFVGIYKGFKDYFTSLSENIKLRK